jgi:hypothetical protein
VDKFEETILSMIGMTPAEMKESITKYKALCACPGCPTYTRCAQTKKELLFCATGRSFLCISEEDGCICPQCPVQAEFGQKCRFFCTKGSESAQRYEHALWGTRMI